MKEDSEISVVLTNIFIVIGVGIVILARYLTMQLFRLHHWYLLFLPIELFVMIALARIIGSMIMGIFSAVGYFLRTIRNK